jgi:predicted SnoaL-like aldol condensation-catalyzing enzyme
MAAKRKSASTRRRSTAKKPVKKSVGRKSHLGARGAKPARRARPVRSASPARRAVRTPNPQTQLEANKKLVLAFYEQIIGRKDFDAALPYMGNTYTQHAPYAADGHDGLRAWLAGFKAAFPNHRYEVKRVIAEGSYVMLHLHGMGGPNPHGESVIDIFRIENGKVVEHWDIIQPIPDSADNANSMF